MFPWLGSDIIEDSVDAFDLGCDSGADLMEHCVGDLFDCGGHSVLCIYGADDRRPALVAAVVLNTNTLDVGDNYEILPYLFVKAANVKFLAEDSVCLAERMETVTGNSAEASYSKSGTGEGLTVYHCMGKTEGFSNNSYLVLKEQLNGLDKLKLKILGKSAYVVVGLDCLLALGLLYALENFGVDSTLRKKLDSFKLSCFFCKYFN